MMAAARNAASRQRPACRRSWERISIYLPMLLMGLLAMGTYWLVKNTPLFEAARPDRPVSHEADYTMQRFAVRSYDPAGRLKSEVFGSEARHFPDTDTLEIDQVRIRSFNADGLLTTATATRSLSNGDGSEVQLIGNAVVVREGISNPGVPPVARLEFRGEFLHAFLNDERVQSHKPVVITRGTDRFTADALAFNNIDRVANLQGRVRGVLAPRTRP